MDFKTLRIAGDDALRLLEEHRSRYALTGEYPFLIGDDEDFERITGLSELNERTPEAIILDSLELSTADWISERRKEVEDGEGSLGELLGEWPGEVLGKSSIGLHRDVLSGKIRPEVFLGLAKIEKPWHLPAILRYGNWNGCPAPEVHCAFHRQWMERYDAEITGMSGDVVECRVGNPPRDPEAAIALAWEQYWYCEDIVLQGFGSVTDLAATLLNSPYWYFWWD